jgi:hypothetical protein
MTNFNKTTILKHSSGWNICYEDGSFPSCNYLVFKFNTTSPKPKRLPHNVGYYGSLDGALSALFHQLIIENIAHESDYKAGLIELRNMIIKTREEFKDLLTH